MTKSPCPLELEQSRRGLGATDGFAFVPHTVAVFSERHLLGVGREIPSPTSESYLTNLADCDPQRDNAAKFRILHKRLLSAIRFCGLRRCRSGKKVKIAIDLLAICCRHRYGFAGDIALLTNNTHRQ